MYKALILVSIFLSSCVTYDPYTEEKQLSKGTAGTAIGAVAGAIIGTQISGKNNRREAQIAGALIGGALGGKIGYDIDKQESLLRRKLKNTRVRVVRNKDVITLIMPGDITFRSGSSLIEPSFYSVLDSVVLVLKEFDQSIVEIAGHTDNRGSEISNQILSVQRSQSVGEYFTARGVSVKRLEIKGYGESRPIDDNNSPYGRRKNRRVEINLLN